VAESTLTAIAYYQLGLFAAGSFHLILIIAPGILIGIPLGVYTIRHVDAETFRRICMSFDAWIVGFGLSRVLLELGLVQSMTAYQPLMLAVLLDSYLLYGFFKTRRRNAVSITAPFCGSSSRLFCSWHHQKKSLKACCLLRHGPIQRA